MTRMPAQTAEQWMRDTSRDIALLMRRGRGAIIAGDVTSRDAQFPPPTTEAERVALANQQVRWLNTEQGWEESYYTNASEAGLTVRGLRATADPGWYPTPGNGPRTRAVGTAAQSRSSNQDYTLWSIAAASQVLVIGEGAQAITLTSGTYLTAPLDGEYDLILRISVGVGSGTCVIGPYRLSPSPMHLALDPITLNASFGQAMWGTLAIQCLGGDQIAVRLATGGGVSVGGSDPNSAQMELRYTSPPFAV